MSQKYQKSSWGSGVWNVSVRIVRLWLIPIVAYCLDLLANDVPKARHMQQRRINGSKSRRYPCYY